jgi:nucleoside-diphosphate-sugar epimerase
MEPHVLVAGATGLVGRAAMEHFAREGVKTTAVSRRRPWDTYGAAWISADLADEAATAAALGTLTDVTQVVFAALHEEPELVSGWLEDRHVRRNGEMLRNLLDVVDRTAPALRNVVILQGPKAYGVHVGRMRPGAREDRDERYEVPNFYWAQENYLKDKQRGRPWSWTVIRPALVVGMAVGGAMNLVAALGVYGALLKRRGEPLHYPGGAGALLEATDTDLMARAFDWAGVSTAAANQTFNVTNGELFSFREQWPVIAQAVGMAMGPDTPLSLAETLPGMAAEWEAIRSKHGLVSGDLASFVGSSAQLADVVLAPRLETPRASTPMSTIKIRRAGFNDTLYSDEMFAKWFARHQADGLLPPP